MRTCRDASKLRRPLKVDSFTFRRTREAIATKSWHPRTKELLTFGPLKKAHGTTLNKGRNEAYVWFSRPDRRGKQLYLGTFDTREEAASMHDRAALVIHWPKKAQLAYDEAHYDIEELTSVPYEEAMQRLKSRAPEHRFFGISEGVHIPWADAHCASIGLSSDA